MGTCTKASTADPLAQMSEEKRKEYYLNINKKRKNGPINRPNQFEYNEIGTHNYDIIEQKRVGYAHIQKTNMFHKVPEGKSTL